MDIAINALAFNVAIPEHLRWRDERRGEEFELQSITVRLLPDGSLAAKAYGKAGRGRARGVCVVRGQSQPRDRCAHLGRRRCRLPSLGRTRRPVALDSCGPSPRSRRSGRAGRISCSAARISRRREVVDRAVALQGQDLPAVLRAIAIRSAPGTTIDDVRAAFDRGEIVRSWPCAAHCSLRRPRT